MILDSYVRRDGTTVSGVLKTWHPFGTPPAEPVHVVRAYVQIYTMNIHDSSNNTSWTVIHQYAHIYTRASGHMG